MPNRTEILHFRATPEQKAAIKQHAKGWESISSYLVEAALEYVAPELQAVPTQPAVESDEARNAQELARDATLYGTNFTDVTGKRIDPKTIKPSMRGETYEQFMERRVGELLDDAPAPGITIAEAGEIARAEWAQR